MTPEIVFSDEGLGEKYFNIFWALRDFGCRWVEEEDLPKGKYRLKITAGGISDGAGGDAYSAIGLDGGENISVWVGADIFEQQVSANFVFTPREIYGSIPGQPKSMDDRELMTLLYLGLAVLSKIVKQRGGLWAKIEKSLGDSWEVYRELGAPNQRLTDIPATARLFFNGFCSPI